MRDLIAPKTKPPIDPTMAQTNDLTSAMAKNHMSNRHRYGYDELDNKIHKVQLDERMRRLR